MAAGQPGWLASSIDWAAHLAQRDLTVWNTLFALTQVAIGLGLLYRPTVKLALAGSFAWALVVWWFGEAFGMLFMNMALARSPGRPARRLLYALIGLLVWPNGRPGGLLGVRGARIMWAALWLVMALAVAACAEQQRERDARRDQRGPLWDELADRSCRTGSPAARSGNGLAIALVLARSSRPRSASRSRPTGTRGRSSRSRSS